MPQNAPKCPTPHAPIRDSTAFGSEAQARRELVEVNPQSPIRNQANPKSQTQIPKSRISPQFPTPTKRASPLPPLRPGTILLITGPSGSGKSSLLRQFCAAHPRRRWLDLIDDIVLPDRPVIDCLDGCSTEDAMMLLARLGLGEAWTYLRPPSQLSEGQRFRLRLAIALSHPSPPPAGPLQWPCSPHVQPARDPSLPTARCQLPTLLSCDEFAAVLDRITAMVVARALRRAITRTSGFGAVLATSHDDLAGALQPDVLIRCDFGRLTVTDMRPQPRHPRQKTGIPPCKTLNP